MSYVETPRLPYTGYTFQSPTFFVFYRILLVSTFCLIALGGLVRSMNAGLACPDWPLCFGRFIPNYHPQVYFEFIHRVLAGSVGLLLLTLHFFILRERSIARSVKTIAVFSILILVAQIILGGLTVLQLLKAEVVTLHLAAGTAFFASQLWIYFCLTQNTQRQIQQETMPTFYSIWSMIVPFLIYFQILLGGWVASHYAGLACVDFPLCNGRWIPSLIGNVGIQVIHRFGAYCTALVIFVNFAVFWNWQRHRQTDQNLFWISRYMVSLVLVQIVLGVANIQFQLPPVITDLHLAVAVGLLALSLKLRHLVYSKSIC